MLNCKQYGETPLHMAAKNGSSEAAKLLLDHSASIEAKANVCSAASACTFFFALKCLFGMRVP